MKSNDNTPKTPYGRFLAAIDARKDFDGLPKFIRTQIYSRKYAQIEVLLDENLSNDPTALLISAETNKELESATIMNGDMLLQDFFVAGISFAHAFDHHYDLKDKKHNLILNRLRNKAKTLLSVDFKEAISKLVIITDKICVKYNYINGKTYWFEFNHNPPESCHIVLRSVSPEIRTYLADNIPRPAYRCRAVLKFQLNEPLLSGKVVPGCDSSREYPVFVQDHVISRLHERVGCFEDMEHHIYDSLWQSLYRDPEITVCGKSTLLSYRLLGYKIGYLPMLIYPDSILLTTFLFLTMNGTPAGDKLRERLNLSRPKKEHTGLDQLMTFIYGDIAQDTELVRILTECGCGCLFDIKFTEPIKSQFLVSEPIRKYLRI